MLAVKNSMNRRPAGSPQGRDRGGQGAIPARASASGSRSSSVKRNWQFARYSDFPLFCRVVEVLGSKVGRRGTVVLPVRLRRRLGIEEGSFVVAEEREDGILIRPATVVPVEIYSPERRAEFLLNNAVDAQDYRHARTEVKRMGLDPDRINHHRPAKRRG